MYRYEKMVALFMYRYPCLCTVVTLFAYRYERLFSLFMYRFSLKTPLFMYRLTHPCLCTVLARNSLIINEIKRSKKRKKEPPKILKTKILKIKSLKKRHFQIFDFLKDSFLLLFVVLLRPFLGNEKQYYSSLKIGFI
jgi:hypothetical protein